MKDLRSLFHKPKVCFILMVMCLSALVTTVRACPPADCSAEKSDLAEAKSDLNEAAENYKQRLDDYNTILGHLNAARTNLGVKREQRQKMLEAITELGAAVEPWMLEALSRLGQEIFDLEAKLTC